MPVASAGFATEAGRQALLAAAAEVELQSGAEVVIAWRAQSARYLHAHLLAGASAGVAMLAFQLFSPWEFSLPAILTAPLLVGLAVAVAVEYVPALQRLLTPAALRGAALRTAAQATFHELGVAETRRRSGVLVYVSALEKAVEIVLDRGVAGADGLREWPGLTDALRRAVEADDTARAAAALRAMARPLAVLAPIDGQDVNELADRVDAR
jgi:putative membrane protein